MKCAKPMAGQRQVTEVSKACFCRAGGEAERCLSPAPPRLQFLPQLPSSAEVLWATPKVAGKT